MNFTCTLAGMVRGVDEVKFDPPEDEIDDAVVGAVDG